MQGRTNNRWRWAIAAALLLCGGEPGRAIARRAAQADAPARAPGTATRPPLEIELRQNPGSPAVFIKHEGPYWTIRRSVELVRDYAQTKSLIGDVFLQYGTTPRGTISPSAPLRVGILLPEGSTHIPSAPMERATIGAGLIARATVAVPPSQNWRTLWEMQRAAGRKGYRASGEAMEIYPAETSNGPVIVAMNVEPIAHSRGGSRPVPKKPAPPADPPAAKRLPSVPNPKADRKLKTPATDPREPAAEATDGSSETARKKTASENEPNESSTASAPDPKAESAIRPAIERGKESKAKHLAPGEFAFSPHSRVITPADDESTSGATPPSTTPQGTDDDEHEKNDSPADPPAAEPKSFADMVRAGRHKRAAAQLIPTGRAADPAAMAFLDQLAFRARAASDAIAERDRTLAPSARELPAALRERIDQAQAAASESATATKLIRAEAADPAIVKKRSVLLRSFDRLLMQLATERIEPAAAWREMLDLLTEAAALSTPPRPESPAANNP